MGHGQEIAVVCLIGRMLGPFLIHFCFKPQVPSILMPELHTFEREQSFFLYFAFLLHNKRLDII